MFWLSSWVSPFLFDFRTYATKLQQIQQPHTTPFPPAAPNPEHAAQSLSVFPQRVNRLSSGEFPEFSAEDSCKYMTSRFFSVLAGEHPCALAPELTRRPYQGSRVGSSCPFPRNTTHESRTRPFPSPPTLDGCPTASAVSLLASLSSWESRIRSPRLIRSLAIERVFDS